MQDLLPPLLMSVPVWLVLCSGLVLAALRYRAHPHVSQLAVVALGGFLLLDVLGTVVLVASPLARDVLTPAVLGGFFGVQTVLHACCVALALTASVLGRSDAG